ncbi:hypothetical protein ABO04_05125 [Nitrosomonas sp. HPC101]|uniref:hypothetical protein n=1 Tax=Nitrosomonas sp. HPC101 TaxID=1658667 RepID=UPI001369D176|nr:hypothetical protein [Nitrosomonas sp. HPC101]MXS85316.1 hypothetical protein [Nitrosomonas sp. HPC101]
MNREGEKPVQYSVRCFHDDNGFWFEVFDVENSAENRDRIVKDLKRVASELLKTRGLYEYAFHFSHSEEGMRLQIDGIDLTPENKARLAKELKSAASSLLTD